MNLSLIDEFLGDLNTTSVDGEKILEREEAGKAYLDYLENEKHMNLEEMKGILMEKGNLSIVACAGAGKTTSLVHKIIYDWITGELGNDNTLPKVWLCTFLHKGADDLREAMRKNNMEYVEYAKRKGIRYQYCSPQQGTISTMHSEYYSLISEIEGTDGRKKKLDIVTETENRRLLGEALSENGIKYTGRSEKSDVVDDFMTALSYTRNRVDDSRYDVPLYKSLKLKNQSIDYVLSAWKRKRQALGKFDFEDLQEKVYEECKAGNVEYLDAIANRYEYLYIDEFQDTSQLQYEILKQYAKTAKKILAIGDDDQTIYTWRGSSSEIIRERFVEDFKPKVMKLSVNYRCPANILNPVIASITRNQKRIPKEIKAYNSGGSFYVYSYPSYADMANSMVSLIEDDIAKRKGKIAVLCRTNTDGILPAMELIKAGIPIQVSSSSMTLNTRVGDSARGIIKMFDGRGRRETLTALKLYAPKESANAEALISVCRNHNQRIWDFEPEELRQSDSQLYHAVARWIDWHKKLSEIECLRNIYDDYIANAFETAKRNQYNEELKGVFIAIRDIVEETECETVGELDMELEDICLELQLSVKGISTDERIVEIATVHEYKGAEVECVYVWNDTQGMFPHIKGGEPLTQDALEEERRIHYIACTRAKKQSRIMTIQGVRGDFLKEMDVTKKRRAVRL